MLPLSPERPIRTPTPIASTSVADARRSARRSARHPRRASGRWGRRGGGSRGLLHRVHEDDRVHERQARVAAPLAALEAVALVGGQRGAAGGALFAARGDAASGADARVAGRLRSGPVSALRALVGPSVGRHRRVPRRPDVEEL